MQIAVIAVPSCSQGGLNAKANETYGYCDIYTIVTVVRGKIGAPV